MKSQDIVILLKLAGPRDRMEAGELGLALDGAYSV